MFKNKAKQRAIREGKYRQIVELLSEEFDWDEVIEVACLSTLKHRDENFDDTFQFICDHPTMAQFRLKNYDGHFVVSHYPFSAINPEREARAARVTEQIRRIEDECS